MKITTRKNQDVTVLDCSGRVEGAAATQWRDAIIKELEGGAKKLLLNLTNVDGVWGEVYGVLYDLHLADVEVKYNATIALVLVPLNYPRPGWGASDAMYFGEYASESEAIAASLQGAGEGNPYGQDL